VRALAWVWVRITALPVLRLANYVDRLESVRQEFLLGDIGFNEQTLMQTLRRITAEAEGRYTTAIRALQS
jgi:hypothetical protein